MTEDAVVASYVASVVPAATIDQITAITRFRRGDNHAVYRVSYGDGSPLERHVVVRISNSISEAALAQAQRESAVLAHLQGCVSPRLLDFRTGSSFGGAAVMCLEHVAGHFEALDTATPEQLKELGVIVRRTHSLPVDSLTGILGSTPSNSTYAADRLQSMLDRMRLVRDPLPTSTQRQFSELARWAEQTAGELQESIDPVPPRLLHGDVSAGNILWTPHPVLIDWEYARIGDPADEIGYLFGQNALTSEQRQGFWRGYGHRLEPALLALIATRASLWEPFTLFGSALYWIDLWSRRVRADTDHTPDRSAPKEPSYYLDFATRYLNRCDQVRHRAEGDDLPDEPI